MKTCLILGASSFTGKYIAKSFKENGFRVVGTYQTNIPKDKTYLDRAIQVDIFSYEALTTVFETERPDYVIHLAGITHVVSSDPSQFYATHIIGTYNILRALYETNPSVSKVILASTSQVYGLNANPDENTPTKPLNDYAVSKLSMENMALLWDQKLPIIITRPFNCIGVGQSKRFLLSKIVSAFINQQTHIELGNIAIERDFIDVRVTAEVYLQIARHGISGEIYNIGTGHSHSISSIIDTFNQLAGYQIDVQQNPEFIRTNDPTVIKGNVDKQNSLLKTNPQIKFDQTLKWIYENADRD